MVAPVIATWLIGVVLVATTPVNQRLGADRSAGYWLHVPELLLVVAALAAMLDAWPPLSRARAGSDWLMRIRPGPLHASGWAAGGGLAALGLCLLASGVAFFVTEKAFGIDSGPVRRRVAFTALAARPYLAGSQTELHFATGARQPLADLELRPVEVFHPDVRTEEGTAQIRVLADGTPVHPGWLKCGSGSVELRLEPPRRVRTLAVQRRDRTGPALRLTADAVIGLDGEAHSGLANCLLAALSYLSLGLLAAGALLLGQKHLVLPVNLALGLMAVVLAAMLDVAPTNAAVAAFARGRWVLGEGVLLPAARMVAYGAALAGVGWLLGRSATARRRGNAQ